MDGFYIWKNPVKIMDDLGGKPTFSGLCMDCLFRFSRLKIGHVEKGEMAW